MPLSEEFVKELQEEAEANIEASAESDDDTVVTEADDDAGTEAVDSDAGDSGAAGEDGEGVSEETEAGRKSGGGESDEAGSAAESKSTKVLPTISDAVLTTAVQHGIPLEDARLFPSEASLQRAIQAVRSSITQFAPKEEIKEEEVVDPYADVKPLSEDDGYDTDVVKSYNAMLEANKKQYEYTKKLEAQLNTYTTEASQVNQQAVVREVTAWFDSKVKGLGEDYKDVLGVGGTDALEPGSPQLTRRDAIANYAAMLIKGGLEDRDQAFEVSAKYVLADEVAAAKAKKTSAALGKRGKSHIQRGSGMKGKAKLSVEEEALQALEHKFGGKF